MIVTVNDPVLVVISISRDSDCIIATIYNLIIMPVVFHIRKIFHTELWVCLRSVSIPNFTCLATVIH